MRLACDDILAIQPVTIGTVVACNFISARQIFQTRQTFFHGKDTA